MHRQHKAGMTMLMTVDYWLGNWLCRSRRSH